jgi:hypothetical protein
MNSRNRQLNTSQEGAAHLLRSIKVVHWAECEKFVKFIKSELKHRKTPASRYKPALTKKQTPISVNGEGQKVGKFPEGRPKYTFSRLCTPFTNT